MSSIAASDKHPESFKEKHILPVILMAEMWERFSFYGMLALLALFLSKELDMSDRSTFDVIAIYTSVVFLGPVLSGVIADRLLGAKAMVLIGAIILIIGHIAMSMVVLHHVFTFIGLGLISIGTGAFKGNITNLLSQVYEGDTSKKDYAFTLFHMAVNLGSALAAIICGYIGENENWGWHYGFGIAAVGMGIGLIMFASVKNTVLAEYGNPPSEESANQKFLGINMYGHVFIGLLLLAGLVMVILQFTEKFIDPIQKLPILVLASYIYVIWNYRKSENQFWNLIAYGVMLIFFICYFMAQMQIFSLLNVFNDRIVDRNILGFQVPASVFQAINPVSIIVFGWFLAQYFRNSKPEFAAGRIFISLIIVTLSFYVIYFGCLNADSNFKVSWIVPVIAISMIGIGEIFIAPLIQTQATSITPYGTRGFMIGIAMISLAVAILAARKIARLMELPSNDSFNANFEALEIYKSGFLKVALLYTLITLVFLPFYNFLKNTVMRNSQDEI